MVWLLDSSSETVVFGETLGRCLHGGECLVLVGDVGAGKTTLVKGIAKGLAVKDEVQSPTFTISRLYHGRDNLQLAHYDFYRLGEPGLMRLELAEALADSHTVTVIEWGQSVAEVVPSDHLTITLAALNDTHRQCTLAAGGKKSLGLIRQLTLALEAK